MLPAYRWDSDGNVIVFAPDKDHPLRQPDSSASCRPGMLSPRVHCNHNSPGLDGMRAALRPREGTAFDVLSSPAAVGWPALAFSDVPIRDVLNRLVGRKDGAAWILLPFEDSTRFRDHRPVLVVDYTEAEALTVPGVARACKGAP